MVVHIGESSDLVGRGDLVAAAVDVVAGHGVRVVTFTGRRGVGKTSVAEAVAAQLADAHHLVVADGAESREQHLARVIEGLGVVTASGAAVVEALRDMGSAVVILDGCTPSTGACAVVDDLLAAVPDLRILVTAPRPLGLAQEHAIPVPPLDLPRPDADDPAEIAASPAVALFLRAADRVHDAAASPRSDLMTVAEVCRRLDGLPEAIVMAAARLRLMAPAAMLEEMSRLGPYELVGMSVHDEVERSIGVLDEPQRRVLLALAVMCGGAGVDAIAAVADESAEGRVVEALSMLVDLQLARADPVRARYALTWSATEYVRARWVSESEWAGYVHRHSQFYADRAREFCRRPHGAPMDRAWLHDHRNRLRALETRRAHGDRIGALRLIVDSMPSFEHRGELHGGRALLAEVLNETPETTSGACIQAHMWLGRLEAEEADGLRTTAARVHFETALRLARERGDLIIHLEVLNAICENQVVLEDGVELCEAAVAEGLALTEAPELELGRSVFLCWHSANLHRRGHLHEAANAITEAIEIVRRHGDRRLLMSYAIIHWQLPRHVRRDDLGVPALTELLDMAEAQGDLRAKGWVWIFEVGGRIEDGDDRGGVLGCLEMLGFARRTQNKPLARQALVSTIRLLDRHPSPALTATIAGALASHGDAVAAQLPPRWLAELERSIATARRSMGDQLFDAARREGVRMGQWAALDLAEEWLIAMSDEVLPPGFAGVDPRDGTSNPMASLTPRERQVLAALAAGGSNKEVAAELGLRPKTVAHHCATIYAKLGVRNRTEAVATVLRRDPGRSAG